MTETREQKNARQRLCRARKREHVKLAEGVEVNRETQALLIQNNLATPDEIEDKALLGRAITDLLDCWSRGTLEPNMSQRDNE